MPRCPPGPAVAALLLLLLPRCEALSGGGPSGADLAALEAHPPKRYIFQQRVDHFRPGHAAAFSQRYFVYDEFFKKGGGAGPILLYLGGEGQLESFYNITSVLFSSIGPALGGLVVFVEHRDYGKSPVVKRSGDLKEDLRFLTVDQALADFALFIRSFKRSRSAGCRPDAPVFLFGGSYGGMLVAWFRIKYPHLSSGGVISSGPVSYNVGGPHSLSPERRLWDVVAHTYRRMGGSPCVAALERGLAELAEAADLNPQEMRRTFGTCTAPADAGAMKRALSLYIRGAAATLAMVNYPYAHTLVTPLPALPVGSVCERFLAPAAASARREELFAALNATVNFYVGQDLPCKDVERELVVFSGRARGLQVQAQPRSGDDVMQMEHWNFQACAEIPLQGLTTDFLAFYPPQDLGEQLAACQSRYGVRADAADAGLDSLSLRYGLGVDEAGHSPESALERSGLTRVVVVDGEFDPWNAGRLTPPQDCAPLSDEAAGPGLAALAACRDARRDVVFIPPVRDAAHHQDLVSERAEDSDALRAARALILEQLRAWATGPGRAEQALPQAGDLGTFV